jgi:RNA polymerase sigma-70 factor (ECF subfamily)
MNEPADAILIDAARNGGRHAQEVLFRRHLRRTRRFAFRLLGPDQDLNDVVQDCMVSALEALHKLREPTMFSSWLGGVVINTVRSTLRHRRRTKFGQGLDISELTSLESRAPLPEVGVELAAVLRALHPLSEKQRTAWAMRHIAGNTLTEISHALGCSPVSVKRWLRKADAHVAALDCTRHPHGFTLSEARDPALIEYSRPRTGERFVKKEKQSAQCGRP